jgi:hypothetical protein
MDKTIKSMKEAERTILAIMRHFEIPPGTMLTGEISGELEYELWAGDGDVVYIHKTKDLAPEEDNPNVMVIRFSGAVEGEED